MGNWERVHLIESISIEQRRVQRKVAQEKKRRIVCDVHLLKSHLLPYKSIDRGPHCALHSARLLSQRRVISAFKQCPDGTPDMWNTFDMLHGGDHDLRMIRNDAR